MIQKLDEVAFGLATSITLAIGMLLMATLGRFGFYGGMMSMMQDAPMYFAPTMIGVVFGVIQAVVIGFILGYAFAYLYNKIIN